MRFNEGSTRRAVVAVGFSLLALAPGTGWAQSGESEEAAVRDVVVRLFDAMAARDTAAMAVLFAPDARFAGLGRDGVTYTTPQEFMAAVASATGPAWIERTYDYDIRIDGPLASVWTYYTLHVGDQFSHCGYDAFQMLRVGDAWQIVHLADSRRKEGCTRTEGG